MSASRLSCVAAAILASGLSLAAQQPVAWKHLSSATGDLPVPNAGKEQTSITVGDFGHDGHPGFILTERTAADSVVLYRNTARGWQRSVIEPSPLHIEAGGIAIDIDGDGNLDYVAAGDWQRHEIWWWRNPYPHLDQPWERRTIKRTGAPKHHDQVGR